MSSKSCFVFFKFLIILLQEDIKIKFNFYLDCILIYLLNVMLIYLLSVIKASHMDSGRENQTVEESTVSNTTSTSIVRHYNAPLSQNISAASTSFAPDSSLASISRVPSYSQSSATDVFTRPDFRDSDLTHGVNIPPWLPMNNTRESQAVGEPPANNAPAIFRPTCTNVPLSHDISAPSTCFVSSSSSASLSRVAGYHQSPAVDVISRPDCINLHLTPGVNIPPWLPMDNRRESQTVGESTSNNSTAVFRPYDVPLSQDISAPSTGFVSSSSSDSLSRAADLYPQSPMVNFLTRTDFIDSHLTHPGVNIPPWLPMDNRRESQTVGDSTSNNSTAVFRPYDVPLSQDISAPSTGFVSSSSSDSLSRAADLYPQSPMVNFLTRTDFIDSHLTHPGVNIPPWLAMDNGRESQTVGESTANSAPAIFRPCNVPLTQDISAPSPGFVSSASLLRATGYPQAPAIDVFTRPDCVDSHLTPGVNIPPWLPMDNRRESQTVEESPFNNSTAVFRPRNVPLSQDISARSTGFVSSSSSASLSRVAGCPQSPTMNLHTRPELIVSHLTPGVNISPRLPMDNRRESQTVGESTVNNSTAMFRPYNVPAMPAFPSSRVTYGLRQSSCPVQLSRVDDYSHSPTTKCLNRPDFTDVIKNNEVRIRRIIINLYLAILSSFLRELFDGVCNLQKYTDRNLPLSMVFHQALELKFAYWLMLYHCKVNIIFPNISFELIVFVGKFSIPISI